MPHKDGALTAALVAVIVVIVILVVAVFPHSGKPPPPTGCDSAAAEPQALLDSEIYSGLESDVNWKGKPSVDPGSKATRSAPGRTAPGGKRTKSKFTVTGAGEFASAAGGGHDPTQLYKAEDVDALIMGRMEGRVRQYAPTGDRLDGGSDADPRPLRRDAAGRPAPCLGIPGVDVGPLGEDEVYGDGIPPQWALPSTPVASGLGASGEGDVYDPVTHNGSVDSDGLHALYVPDHDPLFN